MSDSVIYEQRGRVVIMTLNEPESRNSISPGIIDALAENVERVNDDLSIGCVILTANGPSFSSGGNVKTMKRHAESPTLKPVEVRRHYMNGIHKIPLALYDLECPIIAAVNGPAIGAGCDLAAMCDIRIAGKSAKFSESFARLGLISGDGGAWFLPRVVGLSKAYELTFTCESISAEEAHQIGLVSKVVEDNALLETSLDMANRIATHPVHSLRLSKKLIRDSQQIPLHVSLDMAASAQALARHTDDQREAVLAAAERRAPVFTGR